MNGGCPMNKLVGQSSPGMCRALLLHAGVKHFSSSIHMAGSHLTSVSGHCPGGNIYLNMRRLAPGACGTLSAASSTWYARCTCLGSRGPVWPSTADRCRAARWRRATGHRQPHVCTMYGVKFRKLCKQRTTGNGLCTSTKLDMRTGKQSHGNARMKAMST
jgi:hypothetical protein